MRERRLRGEKKDEEGGNARDGQRGGRGEKKWTRDEVKSVERRQRKKRVREARNEKEGKSVKERQGREKT